MLFDLGEQVGQELIELGQLVAHLARVGSVQVARVVGLVEVERAEVDRHGRIVATVGGEHLHELVDELTKGRAVVVGNVNDGLIGEGHVRADPFGGAASTGAATLIRRPDGLDAAILAEPERVAARRVIGRREVERGVHETVVHDVLHDAVRLLVHAGHNGPVVGKGDRRERVDNVVGMWAGALQLVERGQRVPVQVVPAKTFAHKSNTFVSWSIGCSSLKSALFVSTIERDEEKLGQLLRCRRDGLAVSGADADADAEHEDRVGQAERNRFHREHCLLWFLFFFFFFFSYNDYPIQSQTNTTPNSSTLQKDRTNDNNNNKHTLYS